MPRRHYVFTLSIQLSVCPVVRHVVCMSRFPSGCLFVPLSVPLSVCPVIRLSRCLSHCLFVPFSVQLFVCPVVRPVVCLSHFLSSCLFVPLSIPLPVCPVVCLSRFLSSCLFVLLSVPLFVCPIFCPVVCLSRCPSRCLFVPLSVQYQRQHVRRVSHVSQTMAIAQHAVHTGESIPVPAGGQVHSHTKMEQSAGWAVVMASNDKLSRFETVITEMSKCLSYKCCSFLVHRSKIQKLQNLFSPKLNTATVDRTKMPPPPTPVVKRFALRPPSASTVRLCPAPLPPLRHI